MTIIDRGTKPRGNARSFNLSSIGAPPLPSEHFEAYEVTSAPPQWAHSARHWDLRPGDRILVDWSRRPDKGVIGAVRVDGGAQLIPFDGDLSAEIGRLINPSILLEL